jgi:hypothetical protein
VLYTGVVALESPLNTPRMKELLRTLGMRPSRSAEAARATQIAETFRLSVAERMELALRLGRRDRVVGAASRSRGGPSE